MIRTALVATVAATVVAAGWGCTQSPGGLTATSAKSPAARLSQLEAELIALKAAQAKLADDAAATLARLKSEQEKAAGLTRERDELRVGLAAKQTEVSTRQAERDAARAKLDGFRQELRELLTRVEGGVPAPSAAALGSAGF